MDDILKKIRTDFRRYMNGVVSDNMRKRGIHYKVNFGIDIPRLREMAKQYPPDKDMALYMFSRNVREMKIMATLLYPKEDMSESDAMSWISMIEHHEIREQMCMNLLQYLPFAHILFERCLVSDDVSIRITGYWLFSRLAMSKNEQVKEIDLIGFIANAIEDYSGKSQLAKQSSFNALKLAGRYCDENKVEILNSIKTNTILDADDSEYLYSALEYEFDI